MKILALDFSSHERSVAVLADRAEPGACEVNETTLAAGPFAMIDHALGRARVAKEEIDVIAIGRGPGSYTGIRASIALAQGWMLARPMRLIGVPSYEAIAFQARSEGMRGEVLVTIDAQRGELYLAGFKLTANAHEPTSALRLGTVEEASSLVRSGCIPIGPEATRWFDSGRKVFPRSVPIAELAGAIPPDAASALEPIYLREVSFVKAPAPRKLPV